MTEDLHTDVVLCDAAPAAGPPLTRQEALRSEIATLHSLDLQQLRERWRQLYRTPAPPGFRREVLIRAIAYKLQEKALGGLAPATRRKLLKIAAEAESSEGFTTAAAPRRLRPGTRLVRAYRGKVHTVEVLANGFEWDGRQFGSLSAIAKEITGTSWNGLTFFGVGGKRGASDDA